MGVMALAATSCLNRAMEILLFINFRFDVSQRELSKLVFAVASEAYGLLVTCQQLFNRPVMGQGAVIAALVLLQRLMLYLGVNNLLFNSVVAGKAQVWQRLLQELASC